jgi:hypothetical protein
MSGAKDPNEFILQCWPLKVTARGIIAILVLAVPISVLLLAIAWRVAAG